MVDDWAYAAPGGNKMPAAINIAGKRKRFDIKWKLSGRIDLFSAFRPIHRENYCGSLTKRSHTALSGLILTSDKSNKSSAKFW
jgi:hypothetical protein